MDYDKIKIPTIEQLMVGEYLEMRGKLKQVEDENKRLKDEVNDTREKYNVLRQVIGWLGITKTDELITVKHTAFGKGDEGYKDLDDYLFRKEELGEYNED